MANATNWNGAATLIAGYIKTAVGTIGATGFGVGFVKFLRHAPAPKNSSVWAGCLFDTFQDLASNDSRIGERRNDADGKIESVVELTDSQQ